MVGYKSMAIPIIPAIEIIASMIRWWPSDRRVVRLGTVIEKGMLISEKIEARRAASLLERPALMAIVGNQVMLV